MNSFETVEKRLQLKLQKACDSKGTEIDLQESASTLNELGLLYRTKSPDKISLIQSAALLNAAIVRQLSNQRFHDDLVDLCNHILACANAEKSDATLIEISKSAAEQVSDMRKTVIDKLKKIEKISRCDDENITLSKEKSYVENIKSLQQQISTDYKKVMAYISCQCIKIMGRPPCKYALIGMG